LKNIKTQTMDVMEGFNAYQQLLEFWCQPVPHVPFVQVVVNVPLSFPSPSVQVFSPTGLSSLQLHVPVIYSNFSGFYIYYSVLTKQDQENSTWHLKSLCHGSHTEYQWSNWKENAIWSLVTVVLRNHYTHQLIKTVQTHLYSLYSKTPILHHNADLTEKLKIKESVKSGKTKKNRRLVFLIALVLFIIKIKFTQHNNA